MFISTQYMCVHSYKNDIHTYETTWFSIWNANELACNKLSVHKHNSKNFSTKMLFMSWYYILWTILCTDHNVCMCLNKQLKNVYNNLSGNRIGGNKQQQQNMKINKWNL